MLTTVKEKQYEFIMEMTSQEFNDYVAACEKLLLIASAYQENEEMRKAINEIQKIKNSMLLALND